MWACSARGAAAHGGEVRRDAGGHLQRDRAEVQRPNGRPGVRRRQAREGRRAGGRDDEHRHRVEVPLREQRGDRARGRRRAVQVLDQEDDGAPLRQRLEGAPQQPRLRPGGGRHRGCEPGGQRRVEPLPRQAERPHGAPGRRRPVRLGGLVQPQPAVDRGPQPPAVGIVVVGVQHGVHQVLLLGPQADPAGEVPAAAPGGTVQEHEVRAAAARGLVQGPPQGPLLLLPADRGCVPEPAQGQVQGRPQAARWDRGPERGGVGDPARGHPRRARGGGGGFVEPGVGGGPGEARQEVPGGGGRPRAAPGLGVEHPAEDRREARGHRRAGLERHRLPLELPEAHGPAVGGLEGARAARQDPRRRGEGVQVRARADARPVCVHQLGGGEPDVGRCPAHTVRVGGRHAEVQEGHAPRAPEQDRRGAQVEVQDPAGVGVPEPDERLEQQRPEVGPPPGPLGAAPLPRGPGEGDRGGAAGEVPPRARGELGVDRAHGERPRDAGVPQAGDLPLPQPERPGRLGGACGRSGECPHHHPRAPPAQRRGPGQCAGAAPDLAQRVHVVSAEQRGMRDLSGHAPPLGAGSPRDAAQNMPSPWGRGLVYAGSACDGPPLCIAVRAAARTWSPS